MVPERVAVLARTSSLPTEMKARRRRLEKHRTGVLARSVAVAESKSDLNCKIQKEKKTERRRRR